MGTELRAAIAGAGFIGGVHARSARLAGARVVGVAASTPERSVAATAALGAERAFATAEELVEADDVDVVHICTPNYLHVPLAEAALRAGKHVICEKPLALDAAGAQGLLELAAQRDRLAAVPFVYRFYPLVREARERVRDGRTGPLRLIHGSYLQDWLLHAEDDNWRVEQRLGGASRAFADIGSHWCDLIEFVSGHRIVRLAGRTTTAHPERRGGAAVATDDGDGFDSRGLRPVETEDAALVLFETDLGAVGTVVISQVSPGRKNRLWFELDGAEEALVFDQENPETLWCGRREAATVIPRDPAWLSPAAARHTPLPGGHPQGYGDCFDDFVADAYEAIHTGAAPDGLPGFADGYRATLITEAVLASARTGKWVEVSTDAPVEAAT
ncbi:MAG: gfo/Idh/MocA family oxidoreductase [Solirubrobacterales bacterium]|nr:gfo/Idh/MocA family oxidoreductase [Solirubrobacterales bacterium]